ncbi:MAG: hypothetical protein HC908_01635 [Calothrix sp. SM1_7_51]|nr:hypothetical protein [Calothrix sp. SM1_7_51]
MYIAQDEQNPVSTRYLPEKSKIEELAQAVVSHLKSEPDSISRSVIEHPLWTNHFGIEIREKVSRHEMESALSLCLERAWLIEEGGELSLVPTPQNPVSTCYLPPAGGQRQYLPKVRKLFDYYPSPHWFLTDALRFVKIFGTVGEPCCGDGSLSLIFPWWTMINQHWTNDIDSNWDANYKLDATLPTSWEQFPDSDWIVTNPPFNNAAAIAKLAYQKARVGVVMFLPLTFLEPCQDRANFLLNQPPTTTLVYPRYKFRTDTKTTDQRTIAAFIWDKRATQQRLFIRPSDDVLGFHKSPNDAPKWSEVKQDCR